MTRRNNLRAEVMRVLAAHPNVHLTAKEIADLMIPPATARQVYKCMYDIPKKLKDQYIDIKYSHSLFAPHSFKLK